MAEFDLIRFCNPTDEEYTVRYNGEPYPFAAYHDGPVVHDIARHAAKHLTDKMLRDHFFSTKKYKYLTEVQGKYAREHPHLQDAKQYTALMLDTANRRKALYACLRSKEQVEAVVKTYPQFKAKIKRDGIEYGFIGEMKEYDDFVIDYEQSFEKPVEEELPRKPGRPKAS